MFRRIKTITEIKMVRIVSIGYGYTKHPIIWLEVPYENEEQVNNLLKKVEKKIAEKLFMNVLIHRRPFSFGKLRR